jgi:prevent-host-death family protein
MRGTQPTTQTVEVSEVKDRFGALVDRVSRNETRVLVERGGVLVAALVSADDLARLDQLDRDRADGFEVLDEMRAAFAGVPEEEIEREAIRAVREVREEMEAEQAVPTR